MFVLQQSLHILGRTSLAKQILRNKRYFIRKNRVIKSVDPGIQRRKKLVEDPQELEKLDDYEFDLEADFMNVSNNYNEYAQEQQSLNERKKQLIVEQRYFKENLPNFLTWSDKEQIRYLHSTNPDEWTPEKLSEGFPAIPEIIRKIIKSTWRKSSEHKIQNHDKSVMQNWALFNEGRLKQLPPHVVEHLNKFTNRDLNFKPFEIPKDVEKKPMLAPNIKVGSEFSNIIRSYERLKNKDKIKNEQMCNNGKDELEKPPETDTYMLPNSKKYSKHVTLNMLQKQIGTLKEDHTSKESADKKMEENKSLFKPEMSDSQGMEKIMEKKYATSTEVATNDSTSNFIDYPNKIFIPKNKLKRGYTYKLNDCYYDDDGQFLYRVPGMY